MLFGSKKPATGTALVPATPPARPKAQRNRGPSIIAADLHIVGNVSTEGELHIDGRIDGDVEGRSVTVGESGYIDGHIETREITVLGIVRGSIRARRVHLVTGSKVVADITHDALSIDEGAAFEGHCRRVAEGEAEPLALAERTG
jgi:cytoskeletal protein CcmA (bactofilin family)